jgi:small-conductance mechanosensitive channel
MIFVQRPYDIGDRVSIGDATTPIGINGQSGWIVEKVNLYSTTLRFGATREVATMTNGLLAGTRIINLQRSKKAFAYINLKFGIDVTNANIDILKNDVKEYVDARPREWVSLAGFRMTEIQADLGYVLGWYIHCILSSSNA